MLDKSEFNPPGDEQLIAGTLKGDKGCFGILVERYWSMTVALALRKIKDPVQAEDIAQESFIQAYSQLPKLRDHSRFAGWLSKIVIQKSVNHIRRSIREKHVPLSEIPELASSESIAVAANPGLTDNERQFVRNAVKRLPEKFQRVVIMRFITGLSTPEIARQLGKRAGTVRVWLHRAYQILRKDLASLAEEVENL